MRHRRGPSAPPLRTATAGGQACASAAASRTPKQLPWSGSLVTSTVPPWAATIAATTDSPRPLPAAFVARALHPHVDPRADAAVDDRCVCPRGSAACVTADGRGRGSGMVPPTASAPPSGAFDRDTRYLSSRVTADGRDGYPVEPGRYRLVVSRACPWANRASIVRRLLGLEQVLSLGICGPTHDERSWTFDLDPGGRDPVLGYERLQEAYLARDPGYDRGVTVPAIVDVPTGQVATNDYAQMTLDLSTEWVAHVREGAPDLYPEALRDEMQQVMDDVYRDVNNGVYQCGFARSQKAYDRAYDRLFARLDQLSERLADRRFLMGGSITEADVRLFTTLARFDAVYHGHFKTNRHKLSEMRVLWAYARDLFQTPGFGDTIDYDHVKRHYYEVHRDINPTGIVPKGPDLSGWTTPHGREELGGRPFGDGTPPPPPPADERVPPEHTPLR